MVGLGQPPSSDVAWPSGRTLLPLYCFTCRSYWAVILPGRVRRVKRGFSQNTRQGSRPLPRLCCPACNARDAWLCTLL
jgi:hypothetical protein